MTVDSPAGAGTVLTVLLLVTTDNHWAERAVVDPPRHVRAGRCCLDCHAVSSSQAYFLAVPLRCCEVRQPTVRSAGDAVGGVEEDLLERARQVAAPDQARRGG
jgi:hypothetical protein